MPDGKQAPARAPHKTDAASGVSWNEGDPGLGRVRLAVCESNRILKQTLSRNLRSTGFTSIRNFERMPTLLQSLETETPDFIVCGDNLPGGDVCDLIRDIRHHDIGDNPFALVVIMTGDRSKESIGRIVGAGIDDVVAKPLSINTLNKRVMGLTGKRKPFVVTLDYVGPNRRDGHRPGTERIPLIEVPNPAKIKIGGNLSHGEFRRAIDDAANVINEHKLERQAIQVSYRVKRVVEIISSVGHPGQSLKDHLQALASLARDIRKGLSKKSHRPVAELCGQLRGASSEMLENPGALSVQNAQALAEVAAALQSELSIQ